MIKPSYSNTVITRWGGNFIKPRDFFIFLIFTKQPLPSRKDMYIAKRNHTLDLWHPENTFVQQTTDHYIKNKSTD